MSITIVGLGPGSRGQLTLEAHEILSEAKELFLRTAKHPVVKSLPRQEGVKSLDHLYKQAADFREVYAAIVETIINAGRNGDIVYAVPGDPMVGEATVRGIMAEASKQKIPVKLVHGLSFLEPVFGALKLDPLEHGLQIVDAQEPAFDATRPALFCQVYSRRIASLLKIELMERYPDEHPVKLLIAAGVRRREKVVEIPLFELDRRPDIDHLTCLYVPPLDIEQDLASLAAFEHIIARLRAPEGCPWDREQTHDSLKTHLIEESYEVLDALDAGDPDKLCEELGDLLLQILLHSQIAKEAGEFDVHDVLQGISSKIIRRHPHVFGDVKISSTGELLSKWEEIKKEERPEQDSMLAGVPRHMPALAFAQAIQKRVARVGFDWKSADGPRQKLKEELAEMAAETTVEGKAKEMGDVFFALVNLARWEGIDAEDALRRANQRFRERFAMMEDMARQQGRDLSKLSLEEQDALWEEAKARLRAGE